MARARYCKKHSWAGIRYASRDVGQDGQLALWTRLTIGFWTIEFLPTAAASRVEKVLEFLWGDEQSPKAGEP